MKRATLAKFGTVFQGIVVQNCWWIATWKYVYDFRVDLCKNGRVPLEINLDVSLFLVSGNYLCLESNFAEEYGICVCNHMAIEYVSDQQYICDKSVAQSNFV